MSSIQEPHLHLEVGHILFLDIVGYSKLLGSVAVLQCSGLGRFLLFYAALIFHWPWGNLAPPLP